MEMWRVLCRKNPDVQTTKSPYITKDVPCACRGFGRSWFSATPLGSLSVRRRRVQLKYRCMRMGRLCKRSKSPYTTVHRSRACRGPWFSATLFLSICHTLQVACVCQGHAKLKIAREKIQGIRGASTSGYSNSLRVHTPLYTSDMYCPKPDHQDTDAQRYPSQTHDIILEDGVDMC
jgi:hypothetical protein